MSVPVALTSRLTGLFAEADPGAATGIPTTTYPVATDAIRITGAKGNPKHPFKDNESFFPTGGQVKDVIRQKMTAAADAAGYAIPSGASAVDPDLATLLENGGFKKVGGTGTTVSGAGSTTTVIDVLDASLINVGSVVLINGQAAIVTATDTVPIPDNITVDPPLSDAPADTAAVVVGKAFWLSDTRDSIPLDALNLWIATRGMMQRVLQWSPEKWSFELGGDDTTKWSADGTAQQADVIETATLNGAILAGDLTITLAGGSNVHLPTNISATFPLSMTLVDVAGAVLDEHVIITAFNSTTNVVTVTRGQHGSVAAGFPGGSLLVPYFPDGIFVGDPADALDGEARLTLGAGVSLALQVQTVSVDVGLALSFIEDELGAYNKVNGYVMGKRDVSVAFVAWSRLQNHLLGNLGKISMVLSGAPDPRSFIASQGDTAGQVFGAYAPQLLFEQPEIDLGQETVTFSTTGKAKVDLAQAALGLTELCVYFI